MQSTGQGPPKNADPLKIRKGILVAEFFNPSYRIALRHALVFNVITRALTRAVYEGAIIPENAKVVTIVTHLDRIASTINIGFAFTRLPSLSDSRLLANNET